MSERRRPLLTARWIDGLIAFGLFAGYLLLLLRSASDLGYARDEGFYFDAATSYGRWFADLFKDYHRAIEPRAVDAAWGVNHEHPALMKSLFALSNLFLQQRRHLFAMEGTSFRFPGMAVASLGVALTYLWGARARGRTAGVAAALLLAMMPRFFYQAHLACFDAAIVTMWSLCVYTYWRSLETGGFAWPILTGIAFGLALDTKHNAWFLPFLLVVHALVATARARLLGLDAARVARRAGAALLGMAALGPLVFYALWPWIWRDTVQRLRGYAMFHLNHEYYNMEFLGQNYWKPPMPRGYAWFMTAATVPTVTLLLFAIGLLFALRSSLVPPLRALVSMFSTPPEATSQDAIARGPKGASVDAKDLASTDLLWFGALAISYASWASPNTPIFGGTKHWMTAYPFLALFAGAGLSRIIMAARAAILRERRVRAAFGERARVLARGPIPNLVIGAAVVIAPITETVRSHPFGLTSYTPLVGGAPGAASLGLNRTFWGYTTGSVAGYLNATAPRGGRVYIHDTAAQSWDMLVRDGRIRPDIRRVWSVAEADFSLYHHELHMEGQEYQTWVAFGTDRPDAIAGLDGVPVILVYKRPGVAGP
jgi:4-amino-4-deoxy-L-arabinose transferase-like glycosyltransferase